MDPLIIVVRHRSGVISWQLPYIEKEQEIRYYDITVIRKEITNLILDQNN